MSIHITSRQTSMFPALTAAFPSTRYQGSKVKLVNWIWDTIANLDFSTCLDAFGGTGAVSYRLKQSGKEVTYNDILTFNHQIGTALIENSSVQLSAHDLDWLLTRHADVAYPSFVQKTFRDIYYTDQENRWIDQTVTNIRALTDPYKRALAFFALCQAAIIKRPFNLFHRKNLYVRLADVQRSFGNKASWDRPFDQWFCRFVDEANRAVFDNGRLNRALNLDACAVPGHFDLVYIDTPYISRAGVGIDYRAFYHFLEGLSIYPDWSAHVDWHSKHLRLQPQRSDWTDGKRIKHAFDRVFRRFRDSILVVSYRSDGIPSEAELVSLLARYKSNVAVEDQGPYNYALSTNRNTKAILLIAT